MAFMIIFFQLFFVFLKQGLISSSFLSILSCVLCLHSEMTSTDNSFNLPWLSCPDSWRVCIASVFSNNTVEKYNYHLCNTWDELMISHYCLNQDKSKQRWDSTPSLSLPPNAFIYNKFTRIFTVAFSFLILNLN